MSGYIKTHRKIDDHPLLCRNHAARHLFLDLLRWACWKDQVFDLHGRPVTIKRGSLMISRAQLSERTGMSQRNIRTIISALTMHNIVKTDQPVTSGPMVISICNYSAYQDLRPDPCRETDQTATRQRPVKEEREEVEELKLCAPAAPSARSDRFDEFWKLYPVKGGKKEAQAAWKKATKRASADEIIAGAKRYADWLESPGNTTKPKWAQGWLNNDRWQDELTVQVNGKPQQDLEAMLAEEDRKRAAYAKEMEEYEKIHGRVVNGDGHIRQH